MSIDENRLTAYRAVQKWCERLNAWEYSKQLKRNKEKKLKTFTPNQTSLLLIEATIEMSAGIRTPEELMSLLHAPNIRAELNECMSEGF